MTGDSAIAKIVGILTEPGKANADRVRAISRLLEREGALDDDKITDDPFKEYRARAMEIVDLDGQPTFVTVGVVLERIEQGWVPGLLALTEAEGRALDRVLTIWEHEVRRRLRLMVEDPEGSRSERFRKTKHLLDNDQPWVVLGEMVKQQEAYRARLMLPRHAHGECCTHYEEEADHALVATVGDNAPSRRRK